jgi:exodeoxyribonuclease VII large subunit
MFCQHIAVISSQTAAGYGDFCNQLATNPYGFHFDVQLFPAIMQGEGVEQSIIAALEQIYHLPFDCVVIIRGGGATSDMSGFDTLALAENVANFPIPIITGIGHERDESILDMVSHTRVKTPTAAATLLIDHSKSVLDAIDDMQTRITSMLQLKLSSASHQLLTVESKIPLLLERKLTNENHRLLLLEEKLKALDPTLLLARGYSITLHNGRIIKDATTLKPGDKLETRVAKGVIQSTVTN